MVLQGKQRICWGWWCPKEDLVNEFIGKRPASVLPFSLSSYLGEYLSPAAGTKRRSESGINTFQCFKRQGAKWETNNNKHDEDTDDYRDHVGRVIPPNLVHTKESNSWKESMFHGMRLLVEGREEPQWMSFSNDNSERFAVWLSSSFTIVIRKTLSENHWNVSLLALPSVQSSG